MAPECSGSGLTRRAASFERGGGAGGQNGGIVITGECRPGRRSSGPRRAPSVGGSVDQRHQTLGKRLAPDPVAHRGRRDAGSRGRGLERRGTCLFGGRLRSPDHNRRPRRVLPRRRSQPPHGGALQGLGSITGSGGRKSQAVGRVPGATVPEGAREAVLRTSRPTSSARPNVDSVPLRRRWPHGTSRDTGGITRRGPCRTRSLAGFRRESPRPLPDRVSSRL